MTIFAISNILQMFMQPVVFHLDFMEIRIDEVKSKLEALEPPYQMIEVLNFGSREIRSIPG